jgi:quinol monooxygenase YgiN
MEDQKVIVLAELTVQPQFIDEAIALSRENINLSLQEPGCETFIMTSKKDDPNVLVFFEIWASQEALQWHMERPYAKDFFNKIPEKLAKKPELQFLQLR